MVNYSRSWLSHGEQRHFAVSASLGNLQRMLWGLTPTSHAGTIMFSIMFLIKHQLFHQQLTMFQKNITDGCNTHCQHLRFPLRDVHYTYSHYLWELNLKKAARLRHDQAYAEYPHLGHHRGLLMLIRLLWTNLVLRIVCQKLFSPQHQWTMCCVTSMTCTVEEGIDSNSQQIFFRSRIASDKIRIVY